MFYVSIDYKCGSSEEKHFKSVFAACQYVQNRRGVEGVLIEKCADSSSLDLEDELEEALTCG